MIVCATPRCGGTIFCINKAAEIRSDFIGELSPNYIMGIGSYGQLKQIHHETSHQPVFEVDDYVAHLQQVLSHDKIYLINNDQAISLSLHASSFRVATRNLDRAFRSMADLVIRSSLGATPDTVCNTVARFCKSQLVSNVLITRYCEATGKPLVWFEDHYKSKDSYSYFESFAQRKKLETFFLMLVSMEQKLMKKK